MAATKTSKSKSEQADKDVVAPDPQAQPKDQANPEKDTPPPAEEVKRIAVKAMTPRFRRAGFEFSHRERILDVRRLSEDQLQAILDEPRLAVRPVGAEGQED